MNNEWKTYVYIYRRKRERERKVAKEHLIDWTVIDLLVCRIFEENLSGTNLETNDRTQSGNYFEMAQLIINTSRWAVSSVLLKAF